MCADIFFDDGDAFLDFFRSTVRAANDGGPAEDGVEGGANFVGEGGEEDILGAIGSFGFEAEGFFIGEHGFALALKDFAGADVADVALDDFFIVFLVDVADEFDGDVAAVAIEEGEILVANAAEFHEGDHCGFIFGDITEDADLPEFLTDEIGEGVTEEVEDEAIGIDDFSGIGIEDEDAVVSGFEETAVADFGGFEETFGCASFGDVVEDHDDADDFAAIVVDGSGAVVDAAFGLVVRDEDGVVGEADDSAAANGFDDGAFNDLAGFFVDDVEDGGEGFADGLIGGPSGHDFGRGVHVGDVGVGVGGDDGVADAGEGDLEPFLLL